METGDDRLGVGEGAAVRVGHGQAAAPVHAAARHAPFGAADAVVGAICRTAHQLVEVGDTFRPVDHRLHVQESRARHHAAGRDVLLATAGRHVRYGRLLQSDMNTKRIHQIYESNVKTQRDIERKEPGTFATRV